MGNEFYATLFRRTTSTFITKMLQNLGKHVFVSRANRDTLGEGKKELSATNRSPKQTNPSMLQQSFQTGYGAAL